ncbi:hypothetical protein FRB99_007822 [Tulasnella sp. 403]|nr:hypothetical protein FRB99_007822 [Tulasnella sp. 403]
MIPCVGSGNLGRIRVVADDTYLNGCVGNSLNKNGAFVVTRGEHLHVDRSQLISHRRLKLSNLASKDQKYLGLTWWTENDPVLGIACLSATTPGIIWGVWTSASGCSGSSLDTVWEMENSTGEIVATWKTEGSLLRNKLLFVVHPSRKEIYLLPNRNSFWMKDGLFTPGYVEALRRSPRSTCKALATRHHPQRLDKRESKLCKAKMIIPDKSSPLETVDQEPFVLSDITPQECEELVQVVQRKAFDEGKTRDYQWMADLASTLLTGNALRWYATLDEETQHNWQLLRRALLARYSEPAPIVEQDDPTKSLPTFPSVPSDPPPYSSVASSSATTPPRNTNARIGRLKVISEDGYTMGYVGKYLNAKGIMTVSDEEALQVDVGDRGTGQRVRLLNIMDSHKYLGLTWWNDNQLNVDRWSHHIAALVGATPGLVWGAWTSCQGYAGTTAYAVWSVDPVTGNLSAVWNRGYGEVTLKFAVHPKKKEIYLVPHSESIWVVKSIFTPGYQKATLVFEPL